MHSLFPLCSGEAKNMVFPQDIYNLLSLEIEHKLFHRQGKRSNFTAGRKPEVSLRGRALNSTNRQTASVSKAKLGTVQAGTPLLLPGFEIVLRKKRLETRQERMNPHLSLSNLALLNLASPTFNGGISQPC